MNNKKWLGVGLAVTMISSGALAGCSSSTTKENDAAPNQEEQTINLAVTSEIPTMDSSKATDQLAFRMIGQVIEGLVRLDHDGKPISGVAKDWKVSEDGLTYTFNLREDAKWSDGSPVTAKDFEYAWKRTLNPKTGAEYAFMLQWVKGGKAYNEGKGTADEVQAKAKDDKTFTVTLEDPIPFFIEQMAFPVFYPQKQEFVEKQGDKYGGDADKVLYNGPFTMTEWVHEQSALLVKNDTYWDKGKVRLQKANFQVVKDSGALENLYEAGQLDRIPLIRDQVDRYKDKPEYSTIGELSVGFLQFNEQLKVLSNVKVRKALTYAVDADQYADIIYHNGTKAATGIVPSGTSSGNGGDFRKDNGDLVGRQDNAGKAKQLLAEGLQEVGVAEFPKLKLLFDDGDAGSKATEFVKEQFRQKLGIDVEVENVPFKLRLKKLRSKDFDIAISLWGGDYNDPMTFLDLWVTGGGFNDGSYSNPQYDALIKAAQKEKDEKKRMQKLYEAEKMAMQDMPIGPLFFRGSSVVMRTYVKGWSDHMGSPDYDLKGVYIEGKK